MKMRAITVINKQDRDFAYTDITFKECPEGTDLHTCYADEIAACIRHLEAITPADKQTTDYEILIR